MRWLPAARRRSRRELLARATVLAGLVGFVLLTYAVVVLGGGALVGQTDTPSLGLSVVATALVALGFDPVLTRLEELADRVVLRNRPSAYDTLRRFSGAVTESSPPEELPQSVARRLQEGTGAEWAQVWVTVGGNPVPAATWPPTAETRLLRSPDWDPGTRRFPVRHGEEVLGALVLREHTGSTLTPVEERLCLGLADQAGLVLRGARLRAELEQRLGQLSVRESELRESRERLVDAQDAARRTLERDIHDGAQQHLVALAVNLRLAATLADGAPDRAAGLLAEQEVAAADAVATLVDLSRGIYPPTLEEHGVVPALRAACGPAVTVVDHGDRRYPPDVEAAAYFSCLEAVQNAVKHTGGAGVRVELDSGPEQLTLTTTDEGPGFDPTEVVAGSGLANIRDRVDSVGGTLQVDSAPGRGTRLRAVIPSRALPLAAESRG